MSQKNLNLKILSDPDKKKIDLLCSRPSDKKVTFRIGPIKIRDLVFQSIDKNNKCYFINKDNSFEFFAVGLHKAIKTLEEIDTETAFICGSMEFSLDKNNLFVPKVLIKQSDNKYFLEIYPSPETKDILDSIIRPKSLQAKNEEYHVKVIQSKDIPSKEDWTSLIEKTTGLLDKNFSKVVLSRKKDFKICSKTTIKQIANFLSASDKTNSYEFIHQMDDILFYSMSPETLFKIKNNYILVDAIAGTITRGKDSLEEDFFYNNLKTDPKEVEEHKKVCKYIESALKDLNIESKIIFNMMPLRLPYIQHLHTLFEGNINKGINFKDLIDSFHPTPALCGTPTEKAKEYIFKNESYTRGYYGAPSGYIDTENGESELLVSIRSYKYNDTNKLLEVYGGCGVLKQSKPEKEWDETENKMYNFTKKLKEDLNS